MKFGVYSNLLTIDAIKICKENSYAKMETLGAVPKMVKVSCRCHMSPCMFVQLFKLLSAEGVRQLARSGRKINKIILPLKKKA